MALPGEHSKALYTKSFKSYIFEPMEQPREGRLKPAGQRRDQTTSELFGDYADKDLRASPKTFAPKDDGMTARDKKQAFLSSGVLPRGNQGDMSPVSSGYPMGDGRGPALGSMPYTNDPYGEDEDEIDPKLRRHAEQSSDLFGRETPAHTTQPVRPSDGHHRLLPSDFKWFDNHSAKKGADPNITHSQRGYNEKCSNIFNHAPPEQHHIDNFKRQEHQAKQDEKASDAKRRDNVYYSDIFNRGVQGEDTGSPSQAAYRPKNQSKAEDKITVHQDWTDSKTELVHGRQPVHGTPSHRKKTELHQARIFHGETGESPARGWGGSSVDMEPVSHDNAHKVKNAIGKHTQDIHQAHLRSSTTPEAFYEEAHSTCHWEVVELHVSGLPESTDQESVRQLCASTDLHIVKVTVEMDPVRNYCKGRAKVVVRYNPKRDSIEHLLQALLRKFHGARVEC